jgi:uncharacterized protein
MEPGSETRSETRTEALEPIDAGRRAKKARPFIVSSAALRKQVGSSRHEHRRGSIPGLAALGVVVPDEAEVDVDLTLSSYPGGIMAVGAVTAPWVGECRRCGGPVSGTVVSSVQERFAPGGESGQDEDAYPLSGDELDLEPLARDAVLLDLPLAPLCAETCLGLCPRCGANWNLGVCECPPEPDPRWSALDSLLDTERGPQGGGLP